MPSLPHRLKLLRREPDRAAASILRAALLHAEPMESAGLALATGQADAPWRGPSAAFTTS